MKTQKGGDIDQVAKGTVAEGGGSLLPSLESTLSAPFRTQKRHPFGCLS